MLLSDFMRQEQEKGYTLRQLGKRYNLSPTSIKDVIDGRYNFPAKKLLHKIASADNRSDDEFMEELSFVPIKTRGSAINVEILNRLVEEEQSKIDSLFEYVSTKEGYTFNKDDNHNLYIFNDKYNKSFTLEYKSPLSRDYSTFSMNEYWNLPWMADMFIHSGYGNVVISTLDLYSIFLSSALANSSVKKYYIGFTNKEELLYISDNFKNKYENINTEIILIYLGAKIEEFPL